MGLSHEAGNGQPVDPLAVIRSYLAVAIQIGTAAYNHGDHRGCYEVYACTARLLLQAVEGAPQVKQKLRKALQECSTEVDVTRQAWVLRHTFDTVLGEGNS